MSKGKYKVKSVESYKQEIIGNLETMGIYRPEFDRMIETLATIYNLRDINMREWEARDNFCPVTTYTNKANATNISKHPCFLNNLQYHEQILKYEKALGITPSEAKKLNVALEKEDKTLAEFEM